MSFFVFANSEVKASYLLETNDCDVSGLLGLCPGPGSCFRIVLCLLYPCADFIF